MTTRGLIDMTALISAIAVLILGSHTIFANQNPEESSSTSEESVAILSDVRANLLRLTAIYAKGSLKREYSETISRSAGLENSSFTDEIEIWAKGNLFRVQFDREIAANDPVNFLDLTATPGRIYSIKRGETSTGYVKTRENALDFEGMRDFLVPLLPYSFLSQGHGLGGLNPVPLDPSADEFPLEEFKNVEVLVDGGKETISFERGRDRWQVQLETKNDNRVPSFVRYSTQFEGAWFTVREMEVWEFFASDNVGPLAKRVVMKAYEFDKNAEGPERVAVLAATFTFDLDVIEVNQIEDDSIFEVDFSTVDSVWDADNKVYIRVPK